MTAAGIAASLRAARAAYLVEDWAGVEQALGVSPDRPKAVTVHVFDVTVTQLTASALNNDNVRVEAREVTDGRAIEAGIHLGWWAKADVAPRYGTRLHVTVKEAGTP